MSFHLILASVVLSFLLASSANAQTRLDDLLEPIRVKYGLPALAAAVAKDGRVIAIAAIGTRVLGVGRSVPKANLPCWQASSMKGSASGNFHVPFRISARGR
jgi:hypothetical protein